MRIIFVGSVVPNNEMFLFRDLSVAGNKMQLGFINGFSENNIDTTCISVEPHKMWMFNHRPLFVKKSIFQINNRCRTIGIRFCNFFAIKQFSIIKNIYKEIKHQKPDEDTILIVYNTMTIFAEPVLKIAKRFKCKCGVVVADLPIQYKKSLLRRIEERRQINYISKFDFLIPLTEKIAFDFAPNTPFCVIEAGLDCNSDIESDYQFSDGKKHIVYSGALNQLSGIDIVLELSKQGKNDFILDIFGSGIYEKEVQKYANTNSNIVYHGVVPNSKMISIQKSADLLICPRHPDNFTTKYTFPSKLLEYIFAGVPVLANRLPGVPLEYDNLINIVEKDDVTSWRKAIDDILSNYAYYKRRAVRAKKICSLTKNWDSQCKKVIAFLEEKVLQK